MGDLQISDWALQEAVKEMLNHATTTVPKDIHSALKDAFERERRELAKKQLQVILASIELSEARRLPLCQDTGLLSFFVSGELIPYIDRIERIATDVIGSMTKEAMMRPNVVHPLTRKNTETNTGLGQPEFLIDRSTRKNELKLLIKGAGSENFTNLKMMSPTASLQDIFKHVLQTVVDAGGKVCPPEILGIGIGGSSAQALINSKLALLRPVGQRNPDPEMAKLETALLSAVNELGIGPMGIGGDTTALNVAIEVSGTHTAQLPVAISFGCWANRLAVAELVGNRFQLVR